MIKNLLPCSRNGRGRARVKKSLKRSRVVRASRCVTKGKRFEEQMVQQYLPLVKATVARLAITLPPHVDAEDLYSAGLVGLLNAIRQYNPKKGTAFETYARVRIRGAIFDELRRMDWVPRSVHSKARKVQAAMQELEQHYGRVPEEAEMARELKMTVPEYQQLLDEIRPITFVSLDAVVSTDKNDGTDPYESIGDSTQENPMEGASRRELTGLLLERMEELPEMQRKVLALYYFEDLRLREIAEVFDLTESRICQIHAQAILNIRSYMQNLVPA
jgi:RNA polymerase sigma factor for flagellar operon FliA